VNGAAMMTWRVPPIVIDVGAPTTAGSNGTLTLRDISGTFTVGESITDAVGGGAQIASAITFADAALDDGGVTTMRTKAPAGTAYVVTIDTSGSDARVRLTGTVGELVEWLVDIQIVKA
jgi:hypothetical protein